MIQWRNPSGGACYPRLLAHQQWPWWTPIVAVMVGLSGYAIAVPLVVNLIVGVEYLASGDTRPWAEFYRWSAAGHSPMGLLAGHVALACLIPITWICVAVFYRTRPGWLSSVAGAMRWRWLALATGISLLLVSAALVVMSLVEHAPLYLGLQDHFWWFLLVIIAVTPFQAAAEEYFFRGFLMQAIGSVVRNPWWAIVGSALVFAVFHGVQNVPLFVDRLLFGVLAGVLVWRTGGLEAAVAAHVVNNVLAFLQAGMTTGIAEARALQDATWSMVAWHLGTWVIVAAVLYLIARRWGVVDRVSLAQRA